jgi:hypothetical protein
MEVREKAHYLIANIMEFAKAADVGWPVFEVPPKPTIQITPEHFFAIAALTSTLRQFCYGVERVDVVAALTFETSTPVRFYVTSIYNYIATLYLLDREDLPMGGIAFKILQPVGLDYLLNPICSVLNSPVSEEISLGETIRRARNKTMIHGTFDTKSIADDITPLVKQTGIHESRQKDLLAELIWKLYEESFMLMLNLIAALTASGVGPAQLEA